MGCRTFTQGSYLPGDIGLSIVVLLLFLWPFPVAAAQLSFNSQVYNRRVLAQLQKGFVVTPALERLRLLRRRYRAKNDRKYLERHREKILKSLQAVNIKILGSTIGFSIGTKKETLDFSKYSKGEIRWRGKLLTKDSFVYFVRGLKFFHEKLYAAEGAKRMAGDDAIISLKGDLEVSLDITTPMIYFLIPVLWKPAKGVMAYERAANRIFSPIKRGVVRDTEHFKRGRIAKRLRVLNSKKFKSFTCGKGNSPARWETYGGESFEVTFGQRTKRNRGVLSVKYKGVSTRLELHYNKGVQPSVPLYYREQDVVWLATSANNCRSEFYQQDKSKGSPYQLEQCGVRKHMKELQEATVLPSRLIDGEKTWTSSKPSGAMEIARHFGYSEIPTNKYRASVVRKILIKAFDLEACCFGNPNSCRIKVMGLQGEYVKELGGASVPQLSVPKKTLKKQ